jgi:hypothetical protein
VQLNVDLYHGGASFSFSRSDGVTTMTGSLTGSPVMLNGLPWPSNENACAASSPAWCYIGQSTGTNYSMVYVNPTSAFVPSTDGAVCSCVSYVYASLPGQVQYMISDAATVANMQSLPTEFTSVSSCSGSLCNCGSSCRNPFSSGACPLAGSSQPIECRVGQVGVYTDAQGDTSTYTPNTYGNLMSTLLPTGSVCLSFNYEGGALTTYTYSNAVACVAMADPLSPYTNLTACATSNCGAPAPTWPQCPWNQTATSCYMGGTGPSAAVTQLAQSGGFLGIANARGSLAPAAATVPTGACLSGTATCAALVAGGFVTSAQCPAGQTVTAYLSGVADASSTDAGPPSCTEWAATLSQAFTSIVACGTNNCNAPTTKTYMSAAATLAGYTAATFGAAMFRGERHESFCRM